MKLFLEVFVLFYATGAVSPKQTFEYEKFHDFGIGRRVIPDYRRMGSGFRMMGGGYENPDPLPSTLMPDIVLARDPFPQIYQGVRRRSLDKRVFKKEFDYAAADTGHRLLCESFVECVITHLAIETADGIPIILRGGVGYRHFSVVVRAKPGNPLKGDIKVYCNKDPNEARN